jgi:acetyltransferase-like isoleucine patch superfamily enzyme
MTTFAVTNSNQLLPAVNYLLSNLDTTGGTGNITIPGNVLVANTTTGVVSQSGNATVFGYLYQYVNLRYSNNATGTAGFDTNSNNYSYFGVHNSSIPTPSANPTAYQWYEVSPPFDSATSRTLYYSAIGGRQIQWAAASSPPNSGFQVTVANVAIDLDVVTTATGTPGERGPLGMAYVITTANPGNASSSTLTGWFEASRTANTPPIGTGLAPPVVGDTAYFTYPTTGQSSTFSYNGSVWNSVVGQVVSGDTLVANSVPGSSLSNDTITEGKIANATITGSKIAGNTITGNLITANTITGNNIQANTITGNRIATNTITGNLIVGNTITSDLIAASTITGDKIAGNTITGNLIQGNTITGNLIQSNTILATSIVSGNITSTQIAANTITATNIQTGTLTTNLFTANTISANIIQTNTFTANTISGQAIIANTFSANTINGTAITAGSITTDKLAANVLTANTVVSTGATIGSFTSPGFWLQGNTGNARFGNTISIGNNLTVGNSAVIGTNLTVGNNAQIGGNLNVSGLITTGSLLSNTVATLTMQPSSVTSVSGAQSGTARIATNASPSAIYLLTGTAEVAVPTANSYIVVNWSSSVNVAWSTGGTIYLAYAVYRSVGGGPFTSLGISDIDGPFSPFVITGASAGFSFVDTATTTFGSGVTYRYQVYIQAQPGNASYTFLNIDRRFASITAQNFKR